MKKSISLLSFILFTLVSFSQPTIIEPGDKSLNSDLLYKGDFTWQTNSKNILRLVRIVRNEKEITITTKYTKNELEESTQIIVLSSKTFEPIKETYNDENRTYSLRYGEKIKGTTTRYETNTKENIDEPISGKYFIKAALPFIVSTLPINLNYRAILPVIHLNNTWKPTYLRYKITDVKEQKYFSCRSGALDIWKVTVEEKNTNHTLVVYFEKTSKRIYQIEESFNGSHITQNISFLTDLELDINPIKASFNAKETSEMLTDGIASIKGQASTKLGAKKLLGNKVEYAPKGSIVILIPNSPYFKEWLDFNFSIAKISRPVYLDGELVGGCAYPLPPEVKKHHLTTEVFDNKGNFVFENLKPGEYLVYIGFVANKYSYTTRTPTGDYTITVNSDGTGTATQNIDVTHWMSPASILNYQFVKINKEGETVNVKLK